MKARHFWWAALVVLLAGGVALAQRRGVPQGLVWNKQGKTYLLDLVMGQTSTGVDDLCPMLESMGALSGDYFCLSPDGTSRASSASLQLSAVGSPTTETRAVCGNGPDCAERTGRRISSGNYYATPAHSTAAGNYTLCAHINASVASSFQALVEKYGGTTADRSIFIAMFNGDSIFKVVDSVGTEVQAGASSTILPGSEHFFCATYQLGAGALDSIGTIYVDGTQRAQNTAMPQVKPAAGAGWGVGATSTGTTPFSGVIRSAFITSKVLTPAEIATLSNAALGTPPALLTYTRTGERSCSRLDGSGLTWLAANKPCIANGGLLLEQPATNLALYSDQLENAVYGPLTGLTVTANAATAPDGTLSAESVVSTGGSFKRMFQDYVGTNGAYTGSVYAKAASGSPNITVMVKDRSTDTVRGTATCTLSAAAWTRCTATGTTAGASAGARIDVNFDTGATYHATGVMLEAGSIATSYARTSGTAVTRAGDLYSVPTPAGLSTTEGCARVVTTPLWTGARAPGASWYMWARGGGGNHIFLYVNPSQTVTRAWNGTQNPQVEADFTRGASRTFRTEWSAAGSFLRLIREDNSTSNSVPGFTAMPAYGAAVGNMSATDAPMSLLHRLTLGATPTGCQ